MVRGSGKRADFQFADDGLSGASRRPFANLEQVEETVLAWLKAADRVDLEYRRVVLEDLSLTEQFRALGSAAVIVGVHGGSFAHCLWLPDSTRVLMLQTPMMDLGCARPAAGLPADLDHQRFAFQIEDYRFTLDRRHPGLSRQADSVGGNSRAGCGFDFIGVSVY